MKSTTLVSMKRLGMLFLLSLCSLSLYAQSRVHTVERGETLATIAQKYQVSEAEIKEANPNLGAFIYVGMSLVIPEKQKEIAPVQEATIQPASSTSSWQEQVAPSKSYQETENNTTWNYTNDTEPLVVFRSGVNYVHPIAKGEYDAKWGIGVSQSVRVSELAPMVGVYSGWDLFFSIYNYKGSGWSFMDSISVPLELGIGQMDRFLVTGGGFIGMDGAVYDAYNFDTGKIETKTDFLFGYGLKFSVSVGPIVVGYRMHWSKDVDKPTKFLTIGLYF